MTVTDTCSSTSSPYLVTTCFASIFLRAPDFFLMSLRTFLEVRVRLELVPVLVASLLLAVAVVPAAVLEEGLLCWWPFCCAPGVSSGCAGGGVASLPSSS